jgi:hypothetical protein
MSQPKVESLRTDMDVCSSALGVGSREG